MHEVLQLDWHHANLPIHASLLPHPLRTRPPWRIWYVHLAWAIHLICWRTNYCIRDLCSDQKVKCDLDKIEQRQQFIDKSGDRERKASLWNTESSACEWDLRREAWGQRKRLRWKLWESLIELLFKITKRDKNVHFHVCQCILLYYYNSLKK